MELDPGKDDIPKEVNQALVAWGRGTMTAGQQATVLRWVVADLCGFGTVNPPMMDPRAAGYTDGQRRVGMVIAKLSGMRLMTPVENE